MTKVLRRSKLGVRGEEDIKRSRQGMDDIDFRCPLPSGFRVATKRVDLTRRGRSRPQVVGP